MFLLNCSTAITSSVINPEQNEAMSTKKIFYSILCVLAILLIFVIFSIYNALKQSHKNLAIGVSIGIFLISCIVIYFAFSKIKSISSCQTESNESKTINDSEYNSDYSFIEFKIKETKDFIKYLKKNSKAITKERETIEKDFDNSFSPELTQANNLRINALKLEFMKMKKQIIDKKNTLSELKTIFQKIQKKQSYDKDLVAKLRVTSVKNTDDSVFIDESISDNKTSDKTKNNKNSNKNSNKNNISNNGNDNNTTNTDSSDYDDSSTTNSTDTGSSSTTSTTSTTSNDTDTSTTSLDITNTNVKALQDQYSSVIISLQEMEDKINQNVQDLKTQVNTLNANLLEKISQAGTDLSKDYNAKIEAAKTDIASLNDSINTLKSQYNALITASTTSTTSTTSTSEATTTAISANTTAIAALNAKLESSNAEINKKILSISDQIAGLQNNNNVKTNTANS